MKTIKIKDKECLVDDEDYPLLSRLNWHIDYRNGDVITEYRTLETILYLTMPRLVLNLLGRPKCYFIHINENKLDNRKENLRVCPYRKHTFVSTGEIPYLGVYRIKKDPTKYKVSTVHSNYYIYLGWYKTTLEGAIIYDIAALILRRDVATLNFEKYKDIYLHHLNGISYSDKLLTKVQMKELRNQCREIKNKIMYNIAALTSIPYTTCVE